MWRNIHINFKRSNCRSKCLIIRAGTVYILTFAITNSNFIFTFLYARLVHRNYFLENVPVQEKNNRNREMTSLYTVGHRRIRCIICMRTHVRRRWQVETCTTSKVEEPNATSQPLAMRYKQQRNEIEKTNLPSCCRDWSRERN